MPARFTAAAFQISAQLFFLRPGRSLISSVLQGIASADFQVFSGFFSRPRPLSRLEAYGLVRFCSILFDSVWFCAASDASERRCPVVVRRLGAFVECGMRRAFEQQKVAAAILHEHWFGKAVSIVVRVIHTVEEASGSPYDTSSPSQGPKGRNSPMLRPS